jgi:RNA polymerase sigma factor (sigma-70 family)
MDNVQQEADRIYKSHFGQLVAALLYSSRDINPAAAEDIVHDAFSAALVDWKKNGVPFNPAGWIYKVCRNKALNYIKKERRTEALSERLKTETVEQRFSESILDDQPLKLLFACAHPDLSPKVQLVIALKYVANLRVESIAGILAMTIDGVDKMLLRARQKIQEENLLQQEPDVNAMRMRLTGVHKVLYLIFNEGYKSSWGKEILREELCEEALLMTKSLMDSPLANKDTAALYALMLFNAARFKSRFGVSGELLDLENQDRALWNRELIGLACYMLRQSETPVISSYHIEASIACMHCDAPSFAETDWKMITKLYRKLMHEQSNPFIQLSYAVALYYEGEREQAFDILYELNRHPFFNQYYLLNSTLGKFHQLEGDTAKAKSFFDKALSQTNFLKEKEFIQKRLEQLS